MRVAITGGIAEGKSAVLSYLAEEGYAVASSDGFAREEFRRPEIQRALALLMGEPEPVNPERLRQSLANSMEFRREVNRLMHPGVVRRIRESPAVFIEVPLLIEACLQFNFDQVWVVTCGPDEQIARLVARDGPDSVAFMRNAQLATSAKTPFGDVIIRTNQAEGTVKRSVLLAASRV